MGWGHTPVTSLLRKESTEWVSPTPGTLSPTNLRSPNPAAPASCSQHAPYWRLGLRGHTQSLLSPSRCLRDKEPVAKPPLQEALGLHLSVSAAQHRCTSQSSQDAHLLACLAAPSRNDSSILLGSSRGRVRVPSERSPRRQGHVSPVRPEPLCGREWVC